MERIRIEKKFPESNNTHRTAAKYLSSATTIPIRCSTPRRIRGSALARLPIYLPCPCYRSRFYGFWKLFNFDLRLLTNGFNLCRHSWIYNRTGGYGLRLSKDQRWYSSRRQLQCRNQRSLSSTNGRRECVVKTCHVGRSGSEKHRRIRR